MTGATDDLVCRVLLLVYSGTLDLDGSHVVVVVVVAIDALCCIARYVI